MTDQVTLPHILPTAFVRPWECDGCGRMLGKVVSGVVVIRHGDREVWFPLKDWAEQKCPRCHKTCRLEAA